MDTHPTGIDLGPVFGPVYWGFVISLFLGGITILQAFIYFPGRRDNQIVRLTAVAILILDIASSGLTAQSIYYYLVPHYGSTAPLGAVTPELSAECLLSAIITAISQLYFVYQLVIVKRLGNSGSWLFIGLITLSCLVAFAGGVGCVASMFKFDHGVLSNRNQVFGVFFGVAKGASSIADVLATIAMCMFLTSAKTGMNGTNNLLATLMQFVIHRGALVTLVQVLLLITFFALPNELIWFAFHVNVTKLYATTFFAMLNARAHLGEKYSKSTTHLSSSFGTYHMSPTPRSYGSGVPVGMDYGVHSLEINGGVHTKSMDIPVMVTKTVIISEL